MLGKIGLEEHFAIAETLADSGVFLPDLCWGELSGRLLEEDAPRPGKVHHPWQLPRFRVAPDRVADAESAIAGLSVGRGLH
jgi:hypothetical protein